MTRTTPIAGTNCWRKTRQAEECTASILLKQDVETFTFSGGDQAILE